MIETNPIIKDDDHLPFGLEDFASMCNEAIYVIDFRKRCFRFVSRNCFFLCDNSAEEVFLMGYDYFQKVIHNEDFKLFAEMRAAILSRLHGVADLGEINYFSFTVRIKNRSKYMMGFHKLKPVFVDGQVRFGVCLLSSSTLRKRGHLRLHYNNGMDIEEYLPINGKWSKTTMPRLTKREQEIIRLAKLGKKRTEIAEKLHISRHTLRNTKASLFTKLNVTSMMQAISYVVEHQLLFTSQALANGQILATQAVHKRARRQMTPDKIVRIQERLNSGQSANSIAKREDVSEFMIRYAIKTGKLKRATGVGS